METVCFESLWELLAPVGEFCRRRRVCEERWKGYNAARQRVVYRLLQSKKMNGSFVNPNPYFAIDDNDWPVFLNGIEQDRARSAGVHLVMVKYQGRFLVCTQEMMTAYELEYVRNV